MKLVEPKVFLVGETRIIEDELHLYLDHLGVAEWTSDAPSDAEKIIEVMGRLCYRSFKPGLNPNVTKIREHNDEYLQNIVRVKHGSVIEHPMLNFIIADVSRVFTHELVRHRIGIAISQESLRFVRLEELRMWIPKWALEDKELMERNIDLVERMEKHQVWMAEHFKLDEPGKPFHEKKKKTSFMRRFAPDGLATAIGWSVNPRALRHIIEMRTDPGAEEEIRLVFGKIAEKVKSRYPNLFADYTLEMVDGLAWYKTPNPKV